ncbi:MAG: tRNA-dihydrouridine synthase family protein [Treponema sp.]|nr:tRNA-dihydrouridine synthase family protein [Treponema sp.]
MVEVANRPKLILGPMATLSHEAFRRIVARFGGCDEYFTEMINAGSLIHAGPFEKYYLLSGPEPEKIVWQLTGNRSDYLAQAARIVGELDGIGVDVNMGCSAPQIAKTGAGISWMTKPIDQTVEMIRGVRREVKSKRLSVKMRLGDESFDDEKLVSFCRILVEEGVQMITLHARTKKEKHRGHARWEKVELLAREFPKIPVILNGDVKDVPSFRGAIKAAPSAHGVMVATAAAQKPWIFRTLSDSLQEGGADAIEIDCQQLALDFIDDVEKYQPTEFWKTRLQRFFAYYCLNFSFAHYFQTQMLGAKDNDDSRNRVKEYFEKCKCDRLMKIL